MWMIYCASLLFGVKRLARYLRFFQQEGYDSARFLSWVFKTKSFDRKGSAIVLLAWALSQNLLGAIALTLTAILEENPTTCGKIPLKFTDRAKRIYAVSILLYTAALLLCSQNPLLLIALFQLTPLLLPLSALLLSPDENRRQQKILKEAHEKLKECSPFVIGITGSAGKTSTKNALAHLLQTTLGATFWPEKGINTPMGNARAIKEGLSPCHRFAVMEMGAYGKGSIKRLCDLTPPHAAILTEVGTCHLERFKTVETIQKTKAELAEALPKGSILVLNGDNPLVRAIGEAHDDKKVLYYGFNPDRGPLHAHITAYRFDSNHTYFTLKWQGKTYEGKIPLLGKPALANAVAAFTLAASLGADVEFLLAALPWLKAVDNRLEVAKDEDVLYLKDAYNSNPQGFHAALEVMHSLPSKRKILMTPGMIELGTIQDEQNEKIGQAAGAICDLALIVNQTNQKALEKGLISGGMPSSNIHKCSTRQEALLLLKNLQKPGDAVLIENDLPDIYEVEAKW